MARVLDISFGIAGPYATRLLADFGHDVVSVRAAAGSSLASEIETLYPGGTEGPGKIAYHLNRGKREVTLDLDGSPGKDELHRLIASADYVVHSFPPHAAAELGLPLSTSQSPSAATVVSVTPYGRRSPFADRLATDPTLFAHSGGMYGAGASERPPFFPKVPIISTLTGAYVALAVLSDQIERSRSGRGPAREIDISMLDVMSANLEKVFIFYTYLQAIQNRGRGGRFFGGYPAGAFRAKDGDFMLIPGYQPVTHVALLIDRPDLLEHPLLLDRWERVRRSDEVDALIVPGIASMTLAELVQRSKELRMPCSAINEVGQLRDDPQFRHRGAITVDGPDRVTIREPYRFASASTEYVAAPIETVDAGEAWREMDADAAGSPAAAPATAESGGGPLAGIRVLDLTQAYAGATTTRLLADLGADVVKLESVGRLDIVPRGLIPCDNDASGDWWERSGYFAERNLGKRGITLDLDTPEGKELFLQLIDRSDVVAWNFSPRVMEHWGLGAEALRERNPRLVVMAMSGYGSTGPDRDRYALAGTMEASSGFTSLMRYEDDEPPRGLGLSFGDMVSGVYGALAVVQALNERNTTGDGDVIDLSCAEAPLPFLVFQLFEWAHTGETPSASQDLENDGTHVAIRTAGDERFDERWVLAFVPTGRESAFQECLGLADDAWGESVTVPDGQDELTARLQDGGFAAAPVADSEQLFLSEHFRVRDFFALVDRKGVGLRPYARGFPVLRDGQQMGADLRPPPRLGEHNEDILMGELGVSSDRFAELEEQQIIGTTPKGGLPSAWSTPMPLETAARAGGVRLVSDALELLSKRFDAEVGKASSSAAT